MTNVNVLDRFLRYVKINTESNEDSTATPSTQGQITLANMLVEELKSFGLKDVSVNENCYVMATLPSNIDKEVPVIGFISHLDTSPDMSGENVSPRVIHDYDGSDIVLNVEKKVVLYTKEFPEIKNYIGNTLVVTDGTTLLGADDKAGIAEIMTAVEYLTKNPEIRHGEIKIGFTPDEEIGRGADKFDVEKFGAQYAYTMDGGEIGELEYETFNASAVKITIQGQNVHPGYAKGKMVNALRLAGEFDSMIPERERPYNTEGYEGYFHLVEISGEVEICTLDYIVRDHDANKFEQRNNIFKNIAARMNEKYGQERVKIEITYQYKNMREKIEPVFHIVELAEKAIKQAGIEPKIKPVRGGTDGARLSYMGLPCPNIFAGGHNFHGKFEYVPIESMKKAVEVIVNICNLYAEDK